MRLALSGMKTASAAPIPIKQHPMKYPRTIGYFHSHDLGAAHDNARFQFPAHPAAEPASACETLELYRKRAFRQGCNDGKVLGRAFDKAV
jgi:hypothetical protein